MKMAHGMRKFLVGFVFLCILYFIGGYFAVGHGWLEQGTYIIYASIAGGLASVIGLLSLARPAITSSDIQELEVDSLKRISKAAEELEKYKNERSATQEELSRLALQKEEMEFLVKKASLSIFLKDQLTTVVKRISEIVNQHKELPDLIEEYDRISEKLLALEEEIERDKNVDLLKEVLNSAVESRRSYTRDESDLIIVRVIKWYLGLFGFR
jgi:dimeric dUTPase (all-alpha-NTP-PPase superfamily)